MRSGRKRPSVFSKVLSDGHEPSKPRERKCAGRANRETTRDEAKRQSRPWSLPPVEAAEVDHGGKSLYEDAKESSEEATTGGLQGLETRYATLSKCPDSWAAPCGGHE